MPHRNASKASPSHSDMPLRIMTALRSAASTCSFALSELTCSTPTTPSDMSMLSRVKREAANGGVAKGTRLRSEVKTHSSVSIGLERGKQQSTMPGGSGPKAQKETHYRTVNPSPQPRPVLPPASSHNPDLGLSSASHTNLYHLHPQPNPAILPFHTRQSLLHGPKTTLQLRLHNTYSNDHPMPHPEINNVSLGILLFFSPAIRTHLGPKPWRLSPEIKIPEDGSILWGLKYLVGWMYHVSRTHRPRGLLDYRGEMGDRVVYGMVLVWKACRALGMVIELGVVERYIHNLISNPSVQMSAEGLDVFWDALPSWHPFIQMVVERYGWRGFLIQQEEEALDASVMIRELAVANWVDRNEKYVLEHGSFEDGEGGEFEVQNWDRSHAAHITYLANEAKGSMRWQFGLLLVNPEASDQL
ncbi:hypothetical protein M501DRAFT_994775 [Patellaria atrata CBS 101060]|uniref:Uncharacterized protein n=1 Tax=Patellaria atrata CBS 101060 TaxID=1346257 RepID=A0A9P4SIU9_9PEZI|nr:hypothetical protein M501DRAFT_994775 [Patellaria atrata CBS 101060]